MFTIPDKVLAFWAARNAERRASGREPVMPMGAGDFRRIEAVWGLPLPEAYKRFLSAYGPVAFPDDFSAFDYTGNARDGNRSILQGEIACMASVEVLEIAHRHLIADPDNETGEPFFPPNMLCFAGNAGTDQLLLELGTATPRVWFWKDSNDAFGQNDNRHLGFVADTFDDFINTLRPSDYASAASTEARTPPVCTPQTPAEIDGIEEMAGISLPAAYRTFLATRGQTNFDPPRQVGYEYPDGGMTVVSSIQVDEIFGYNAMRKAIDHGWGATSGPLRPSGFLPIGLCVPFQPLLMGFGDAAGIWYPDEPTHPWAAKGCPRLRLIQPDFESFAAALG